MYTTDARQDAAAPSNDDEHSSAESFEADEEGSNNASGQWQSAADQTSPDGTNSSGAPRSAPPMQKRRRVTRACDECRRKKIKCDGKQPCTHCTVYSYDCTYDQPSNRRRNPAPQYIEALEVRLQRAEALLKTFNANVDLNDPNLDSLLQQRQGASTLDTIKAQVAQQKPKPPAGVQPDHDAQLQSMIESTGSLDIDERGNWDFHGGSSGTLFWKRMREQFGGLLGGDQTTPFLPRSSRHDAHFLDSPRSTYESPHESGLPNTVDLPPKAVAKLLSTHALTRACALLRFVHLPTFWEMFDKIYDTPAETFGDTEHRFLPLLYQVLALGCMFSDDQDEVSSPGESAYKSSMEQGLKYFRAARAMMDITDCRDITSLQCIIFMILFLQSTSNLSTCYSYIGVALRSAVRMGLHRNISTNFNPIERETRRRVFWIIRKMDTYVSALLGFPRMLSDSDIDQELPLEIDDIYITKDGIGQMPEGKTSLYAASNAHTRLMSTLAKVIEYIYPIKGIEQSTKEDSTPTYAISHSKIREVERDLQDWLDKLPMALRPGGDSDEEMVRSQQLLRMGYAHVQMMLYRPFLHYVSHRYNAGKNIDERSYACAAACVSVSRNIVHICAELKKRGLLVGAYWFTMYTTFFAILSLVFFVLENPNKQGAQEILADAMAGKEALSGLARRSMAADRCSMALEVGLKRNQFVEYCLQTLQSLFEKLPGYLNQRAAEPLKQKKRAAPTGQSAVNTPVRASPDQFNLHHKSPVPLSQSKRASTFPMNVAGSTLPARQTTSFDSPRYASGQLADQTNLRRSYHELMSPAMSGVGTPDSSSTGNSIQAPFNPYSPAPTTQPFMGNTNLPDLGAMMFPSADPFAYPNQPMMEFDQRINGQQQDQKMSPSFYEAGQNTSNPGLPDMYMNTANENSNSPYDNLQGQLFGPLPPYLLQGQQMDMGGLGYNTNVMMPGGSANNSFDMGQVGGGVLGNGMNFDDIFASNNDEWNNVVGAQGFRGQ